MKPAYMPERVIAAEYCPAASNPSLRTINDWINQATVAEIMEDAIEAKPRPRRLLDSPNTSSHDDLLDKSIVLPLCHQAHKKIAT
jgi:hypothetical protein